jgi:hypothetical protein
MERYAGLDLSLEVVSICGRDDAGLVLWRGEVANDADVVAAALSRRAIAKTGHSGTCGAGPLSDRSGQWYQASLMKL